VVDLFNDLVNCTDESGATAKSICTKLLMQTVRMTYLVYLFVNIYPRQYFL
jgi:hypothetical protein